MRYKMTLSYDGAWFHGFQRQKNEITVQGEIEKSLTLIFKKEIEIKSAGRTDALVHAKAQVVHFDSDILIPTNNLKQVLNNMIAPHIYVLLIEIVDESFHARLTKHTKEYRYYISTNEFDPLRSSYIYFYPYKLDVEKIKKAMTYFLGTKDFEAFSKGHDKEDTIRTIERFELIEKDGELEFIIVGNGFLRNMVRIIIATLIKVSEGKLNPDDIKQILDEKDRTKVPWCAPGEGLYLYNIEYKKN